MAEEDGIGDRRSGVHGAGDRLSSQVTREWGGLDHKFFLHTFAQVDT